MADIALRFHKDMLVLSSPITASLARQGVAVERDLELVNLLESESIFEAQQLEMSAGAACLVTNTQGITPARLAHQRMEEHIDELAASALAVAHRLNPQHIFVEIGPCGLPLDPSSKASLNEQVDQYLRAARCFEREDFDAYFLSGFQDCASLKCALIGLRRASDRLILASVDVMDAQMLAGGREDFSEAVAVMVEYGAAAVGFATARGAEDACAIAKTAVCGCNLPVLAELCVTKADAMGTSPWRRLDPTKANPYPHPEALLDAAIALRASGVQFLRAIGDTHAGFTAVLSAAMCGLDVVLDEDLR